jgi:type VI secretion system protein ImpK
LRRLQGRLTVTADGDDDRTILRPTPGGRKPGAPAAPANGQAGPASPAPPQAPVHPQQPPQAPPTAEADGHGHAHGQWAAPDMARSRAPADAPEIRDRSRNPLIAAGATLLTLAAQLRNTSTHGDVEALRARALQAVQQFDQDLHEAGVSAETANMARYAVCSLLDETILNTPWGSQSIWATSSLLITLYRERTGGERIFQLIDQLSQRPRENHDILEFLFVCLCLGFQGRYAVQPNGQAELAQLRERLHHTLRQQRADTASAISPHWAGLRDPRPTVARTVPLWVAIAAAGALITGLFVALTVMLNSESDRAFARLTSLLQDGEPIAQASASLVEPAEGVRTVPEVVADLRAALAPEIRAGKVQVMRAGNQVRVRLRNRGLFGSGSARVSGAYEPVLAKIAREIRGAPKPILITGHSDNVPIRTVKFPSNWHLSSARAEAVMATLQAAPGNPGRFVAEGRSDSTPIADNATAEGRAKNRRVEINLRPW